MSTGKTQHLFLNQWQPNDDFLREEFNADNSKLDQAVLALRQGNCMERLFTVVTQADAHQVDLDVSAVNWPRYTEVLIYSSVIGGGHGVAYIRANNVSATDAYEFCSNGTTQASTYLGWHMCSDSNYRNETLHTIPCLGGTTILFSQRRSNLIPDYTGGRGRLSGVSSLADLRTLNFYANSASNKLLAGTSFYGYGVRR